MNDNQQTQEPLLPRTGNYRKLFSYQKAEAIYDITYYFCKNYLQRFDRTIDQMVQAARSGKQNIVEGCAASATSKETEIKLVNVAKASLHEMLIDYLLFKQLQSISEDFLKNGGMRERMTRMRLERRK